MQDTFSISVYQQGPTIQNYRNGANDPTTFYPSTLSLVLMKEDGTFIGSVKREAEQAPYINEDTNLAPGKYIIAVNAAWNDVAKNNAAYRDLNIDLYTN